VTDTRKRFTLPLSSDYCAHWQRWEAVREIVQNAFDAVESPSLARIEFEAVPRQCQANAKARRPPPSGENWLQLSD
jgi:hypothetical protein